MTTSIRRRWAATAISAVLVAGLPALAGAPAQAVGSPTAAPAATTTATSTATTSTVTTAYVLGERKLRRGDRGRDVRRLQRMLFIKRTGVFNARTERAVKRVQRANGLRASGVVNAKTLTAITRLYRLSLSSRSGARDAASPTEAKKFARMYISYKYGWGDRQMSCLDPMWERESGWRYWVSNPNGIYRGIPQTSSRVWGPLGYTTSEYMSSPAIQIRVGTHYIKGRYGTPCRAWSFWKSHHWY